MKPPFNEEELPLLIDGRCTLLEVLANRRETAVLRVDRGVMRISRIREPIRRNSEALELLQGLEIAPKLIDAGDTDEIYFSLEEHLPGTRGEEAPLTEELLHALLEKLSVLHSVQNSAGLTLNWREALFERYRARFAHVPEKYVSLLEERIGTPARETLLHGMLEMNNVILLGSTPHLVDFEDSLWGEPEFDLGALYYKEFFPEKLLSKLCSLFNYDEEKALLYALYFGVKTVGKEKSPYKEEKVKRIFTRLRG